MMMDKELIQRAVSRICNKIKETRHELHRIPELAFCEKKTAAYICKRLDEIGVPYQSGIAKTGVVALIKGKECTKTLLLRADMDALPMQEDKTRENASEHDGVMHACGHDAHVAVLLGVAEILWEMRESLSCSVKLVFQPAEEDTGGAQPMIEEGILSEPKVDAALALHVMNEVEVGKIRVKSGPVMACPDEFDLTVKGKGGHGAYPEECINPIAVASKIITELGKLAKELNMPERPVVISVCSVDGGTFYNIIPDEILIRGTARMYDSKLRAQLPDRIEKIIKECCDEFGASYKWDYRYMFPPLINNEEMADDFAKCAGEIIGESKVIRVGKPSMAGDDFAYFAERVPSVYFNLGSGNKEKGIIMPLHASDFDIDEDCLAVGVAAMCWYALSFGKNA